MSGWAKAIAMGAALLLAAALLVATTATGANDAAGEDAPLAPLRAVAAAAATSAASAAAPLRLAMLAGAGDANRGGKGKKRKVKPYTSPSGLFIQERASKGLPGPGQHFSFGALKPWDEILGMLGDDPGALLNAAD